MLIAVKERPLPRLPVRVRVAVVLTALPFFGCAADESRTTTSAVRDSAGVMIVTSLEPAWQAEEGWRVGDLPIVEIGRDTEDPAHQLYRVSSAIRLSDSRIVIGNAGTQEVRIFEQSGRHVRTVGREGEGPGEFLTLSWVKRAAGDSIVTFDTRLKRVSIFDPDGDLARVVSLAGPETPASLYIIGFFDSGRYLAWGGTPPISELSMGLRRDSVLFRVFRPDGTKQATLGRFPGGSFYVQMRTIGSNTVPLPVAVPFSPAARGQVHGQYAYIGVTDSYEVRLYDASATLHRIVRKAHANLRVRDQDLERFLADRATSARSRDPWSEAEMAVLREAPVPQRMPAYRRFRVGGDEHLWIEDYRRPGDETPVWQVFDPEGRLLGPVALPVGFDALEFGADYVLGRATDELDIERVLLYELVK